MYVNVWYVCIHCQFRLIYVRIKSGTERFDEQIHNKHPMLYVCMRMYKIHNKHPMLYVCMRIYKAYVCKCMVCMYVLSISSHLCEFDEQICESDEQICEFDEQICEFDEQICEFDEQICESDEQICEFDEQICSSLQQPTDRQTYECKLLQTDRHSI